MKSNILLLRHSQFCDDGFVLGIQNLNNLLEHLNPACYRLFSILKGELCNQASGQLSLIFKCIAVKLFFFWLVICDRRCPNCQGSTHEVFATFLQLCQRPLVLPGNPGIHTDTAVIKTILHGFLFSE